MATHTLRSLSPDGRLLFVTRALRMAAYGSLSVILALYLDALGLTEVQIGLVLTTALGGSALLTVVVVSVADRMGRRRFLAAGALAMAMSGVLLATTDNLWILLLAALLGTISPTGGEVGPFLSLEQAMLPDTLPPDQRTAGFAWYNLVGSGASATGALAVGLTETVQATTGWAPLESYRLVVWLYVACALSLVLFFRCLSPQVEAPSQAAEATARRFGLHQSRGIVLHLAALFSLDAFAGGFVVQSLVAYWLRLRYGIDVTALGALFFGTNLLSALSFLAAANVAARIGLINTMVFTHLPSNILLMLVPLMPTAELASLMLLMRHMLSQMDVPTRQSYIVAVVAPDERAAAAGFTNVTRQIAAALSPVLVGLSFQTLAVGLPFFLSGLLKSSYDLLLYRSFRHIRPPEERS